MNNIYSHQKQCSSVDMNADPKYSSQFMTKTLRVGYILLFNGKSWLLSLFRILNYNIKWALQYSTNLNNFCLGLNLCYPFSLLPNLPLSRSCFTSTAAVSLNSEVEKLTKIIFVTWPTIEITLLTNFNCYKNKKTEELI